MADRAVGSYGRHAGPDPALPRVVAVLPTPERAVADTAAAVSGHAVIVLAGLTPAATCRAGGQARAVDTRELDIYPGRGDVCRVVAMIEAPPPAAYQPHRNQSSLVPSAR